MSTPAVSICVPTYNGAAFLRETLASALAQTFGDFELIVVDDASTDATPDIVAGVADPRLRSVRHATNAGVGATWNEAVALARAPLVKLLCHDDTLRPECVAEQMAAMSDPDVVLVACWREVIDLNGRRLLTRRGMGQGTAIERRAAVRAMVRSGTNPIGEPSATLFRKTAWEAVGGFSAANLYMIDVDLWLKLLRHGTLAFVPRVLASYRVSPTALSTVLAKKQIDAGRRFMADLVREPDSGLSRADLALGVARATIRSWGRQALYLATRRRTPARRPSAV